MIGFGLLGGCEPARVWAFLQASHAITIPFLIDIGYKCYGFFKNDFEPLVRHVIDV